GPELRHATVKLGHGRLLSQLDIGDELDLGMVAERKTIGLRPIDIRHVADGAGFDQRSNHRGAERPGSAGNDHVAIAIVHRPLPWLANALASSSMARPMQGRVMRRLS